MILRAISKFNWRSLTYEVGAILEADLAKGLQMIREGLAVEEKTLPMPEPPAAFVEPAAPTSEPTTTPVPLAGDPGKPVVVKKKSKSKKK